MDVIYPEKCIVCHSVSGLTEGEALCVNCRRDLQPICEPRCKRCSKPLKSLEKELCEDCGSRKFSVERGMALYPYDQTMRRVITNFKYGGELACGDYFAQEIARQCGEWIRKVSPEVIIPVPIHKKRMRFRGFNQAAYMAERIGTSLHIEVLPDYLVRTGNTKPQKELDVLSRRKNLEKGFCVNGSPKRYRTVLLFDDIYTTGATLEACGKVLKNVGTERIYYLSLCIGRGD